MSGQQGVAPREDAATLVMLAVLKAAAAVAVVAVAAPAVIPWVAVRVGGTVAATRAWFWRVGRWQWVVNTAGAVVVGVLLGVEALLLVRWAGTPAAARFFTEPGWPWHAAGLWPWLVVNLVAGVLLLPVVWSARRRQVAGLVRQRRIPNVVHMERIEQARRRAADQQAARAAGVRVDTATGTLARGKAAGMLSAPVGLDDGAAGFGLVARPTVRTLADRYQDIRRVRDWTSGDGRWVQLPRQASAARFVLLAESGTGKTVLLHDVILCALSYGWRVVFIDAKGDPADADRLAGMAHGAGHAARVGGRWNMFTGTADQITSKIMRLLPPPDGANEHYLKETRGVLQAVQGSGPLTGLDDLRARVDTPAQYVRDQFDLDMVEHVVDSRSGMTAGQRVLHELHVTLRPLEDMIGDDGWSYQDGTADLTVVPLSPVDDAQAALGDLMLLDLRAYLTNRLHAGDRSAVLVLVDEFPQLVAAGNDPGDTAAALFETARSAGVGLGLAGQSAAGLSDDPTRRERALGSGAALVFGRQKAPEDIVGLAGTVTRMEASAAADGGELKSARAQHTYLVHPQQVREAADAQFWIAQAGAVAPFRCLATPDPAPAGAEGEPVG